MAGDWRRVRNLLTAVVAIFFATAGLAYAVSPRTARTLGLDIWNYVDESRHLEEQQTRERELNATQDRLSRSLEATRHVAALFIDGRLSLAGVLDELDSIHSARPEFHEVLEVYYPSARTKEERLIKYLLVYVKGALAEDPSRLAEVENRVEREFLALSKSEPRRLPPF